MKPPNDPSDRKVRDALGRIFRMEGYSYKDAEAAVDAYQDEITQAFADVRAETLKATDMYTGAMVVAKTKQARAEGMKAGLNWAAEDVARQPTAEIAVRSIGAEIARLEGEEKPRTIRCSVHETDAHDQADEVCLRTKDGPWPKKLLG